jgi:hypothetical protein
MSLSQATAAPAPVRINGKEYSASPLDLIGLGELEEYARGRLLEEAEKVTARLPASKREAWLDRAMKMATAVTFDSEEFRRYITSKSGMEVMLAISLRPRHPGMTPETVAQLSRDHPADIVAAVGTILRISGLIDSEEKGGQKPGEGGGGEAGV